MTPTLDFARDFGTGSSSPVQITRRKQAFVPSTCRSKWRLSRPASLAATHVYLALSSTLARRISILLPPSKRRTRRPDVRWGSSSGRPSTSQLTLGRGTPVTGHSSSAVPLTRMRGLATRLASSSVGGTAHDHISF